ncbi:MAG TPA: hypothetical protein VKQ52_16815, partial [Puia sp.]|nr:hypothetical protein [Puia sp.]
MRQDDALWKSILESTFEDFLRFFFRDADEVIDFHRGFEFLDKELAQLCISGRRRAPKVIDKLAKVYMRGGKEEWLLLHIEVQGYREPGFEKRMFRYCYRLMDKYEKPITAIVILTDP